MRRSWTAFALLIALVNPSAVRSDSLPRALAGTWHGYGQVRGMQAVQCMTWSEDLEGRFTRLELESRLTPEDGAVWIFRAHAYYRSDPEGQISGYWFDSRGAHFPLHGNGSDASMIIDWGTPALEQGRSEYRLVGGRLRVTDSVLGQDGNYHVFGRTMLRAHSCDVSD